MRTLFLDCSMGAAGDMLFSALYELIDKKDEFLFELNNIGIPGLSAHTERIQKQMIYGTKTTMRINDVSEDELLSNNGLSLHPEHTSLPNIKKLVNNLNIKNNIKQNVLEIYDRIAKAESIAHNCDVSMIHFHEVGALDAIADITGVCMLMDIISPCRVVASPVCTGYGHINCAHGEIPVPAPATANLLLNVPTYAGTIQGELCTPTGAALITHFATEFSQMPLMKTERIGYGMGTKNFPKANCLRAFLGETNDITPNIIELDCNIDDMTPEDLSFAASTLMNNGALDVFFVPIYMKKNRPATLLRCMCAEEDCERFIQLIFKHTSTLGIRKSIKTRCMLERHIDTIDTPYGEIRIKKASGYGVEKSKPEYDDLERIARNSNLSIDYIRKNIEHLM